MTRFELNVTLRVMIAQQAPRTSGGLLVNKPCANAICSPNEITNRTLHNVVGSGDVFGSKQRRRSHTTHSRRVVELAAPFFGAKNVRYAS